MPTDLLSRYIPSGVHVAHRAAVLAWLVCEYSALAAGRAIADEALRAANDTPPDSLREALAAEIAAVLERERPALEDVLAPDLQGLTELA